MKDRRKQLKLTPSEVLVIRKLLALNVTQERIAEIFDIGARQVRLIKSRKQWSDI